MTEHGRLIDADALKAAHGMKDDCADCDKELRGKSRSCQYDIIYSLMDFCGWVDDAPTIEPECKRGKWIKNDEREGWLCSCCNKNNVLAFRYNWNYDLVQQDNFCPSCGADMRTS